MEKSTSAVGGYLTWTQPNSLFWVSVSNQLGLHPLTATSVDGACTLAAEHLRMQAWPLSSIMMV